MRNTAAIVLCFLLLSVTATAQITFDADFESGALGKVSQYKQARTRLSHGRRAKHYYYQVGGHFDPPNPIDTTEEQSTNWYYFRISGVSKKYLHLKMPDNTVLCASYSYDGVEWKHFTQNESKMHQIDKYFDKDTVYIAAYKPYNYSYLQERLGEWSVRQGVVLDTIGLSYEGRPMQLLRITDPEVPDGEKARIWIHGRIHPSETPASYVVDGLVDYLTGDSPEARSLRRQIDAYILPFANPDGVALGYSRTNARGINQEINYGRGEDSTCVEVRRIKRAYKRIASDRPFDVMLNSHSQRSAFASFWMHKSDSTSLEYLRKQWTFTGLVCSQNPYFNPEGMSFSYGGSRYFEGWIWNNWGAETVALTIETPYNYYSTYKLPVDDRSLRQIGERTILAIAEYLGLSLPGRYLLETPEEPSEGWTLYRGNERSFLGEGAWKADNVGLKMEYRLDSLPSGRYNLYRFVAGNCVEPKEGSSLHEGRKWLNPGVHGWEYVEYIVKEDDGPFSYIYEAADTSAMADALLLLKQGE